MDVVQDYSAEAVLETLGRFTATKGWPNKIRLDPGSQLEAGGGCLEA